MKINLENAEYIVDLIADDLPFNHEDAIFDKWLELGENDYGWEFAEQPTTYEGIAAREIGVYWESREHRLEEPMAIIVVAKKPKDWAKGYVYLTNGRLKDFNGKQVIVIFGIQVTGNKTEKYVIKKADYDQVQAMLENEERKQITLIPQSINKTVIL